MNNRRTLKVKIDGYTRFCLTAIAVLMTLMIIGLWAESPRSLPDASAAEQPWKTNEQRAEQLEAQKETNKKLDEIIRMFKEGQAKVQVAGLPEDSETKTKESENVPPLNTQ